MADGRHAALVEINDSFRMMQGAVAGFLARCERELELTGPHLAALEAVAAGATKVGDVAKMTRTHVSSASRAVDSLVEEGLLLRDQDPSDRRAVILSLTPQGSQRMARFADLQIELMRDALRELSDAEMTSLAATMVVFGHGVVRTVAADTAD